jgi:hypothetical protein
MRGRAMCSMTTSVNGIHSGRGGAVQQLAAVLRIKPLWRRRCCALVVCGYGESGREATKISTPVAVPRVFPELRQARLAPSRGGAMQQLAAVLRIKPLWRRRCCALVVCGYGESGREAKGLLCPSSPWHTNKIPILRCALMTSPSVQNFGKS